MKKILAIMLSVLMVISVIPMAMISASAEEEESAVSSYKYQTVINASDYDGVTLKGYASPWYTAGLTRAYNTTYVGYDSTLDAMEIKRGAYDPAGLYYFDSTLGATAANSLGFRVWMKGGTDADTTSTKNLYFIFDTIDGETHTAYAAAWYTSSSYGVTVPADGGWVEFLWADMDKNFRVNTENAFIPNASNKGGDRPTLSVGSGSVVKSENWLSKMDGFAIGLMTVKTNAIYYVGDVQFIMPYTVKVDGEAYATGTYGETITLPDEEVIGYSDGKTLYAPGSEVTITGDMEFTTIIRSVEDADFDIDVSDKIYTAEKITTTITPLTGLVEDKDYWVYYKDNKEAGTATVVITGLGNYVGSVEKTFNIVTRTIGEADFSLEQDTYEYTGQAIEPQITTSLESGDYEVAYSNNVNVSDSPVITITGKGNCSGTVTLTFNIAEKALEKEYFTFDLEDKIYTGEEIKPTVTSTLGEADYEVSYSDNVNVGVATVTVTGKGNYKGTVEETFNITEKAITDADFTCDLDDKVYTGEEIKPEVKSTLTDADYDVAYSENENVGIATITVTGKGNYKGTIIKTFEITPKALEEADFAEIVVQTYANKAFTPAVTVLEETLTTNDYDVSYSDNENVGVATVTITGKNNFKGEIKLTFVIEQKTILESDFTIDTDSKTYTGEEIKPIVSCSILKDTDYEVTYSENVNKGRAKITVKGVGNCKGEITKEFEIVQKAVEDGNFTIDVDDKVYTGSAIEPSVSSELVKDVDYTVDYSENENVGTATITVTGIGNYQGTVTKTFAITEKAIEESDFTFDLEDKIYTGEEIKPEVTSSLTDADYDVAYIENENIGIATITVTGKGNYKGTITKTFVVVPKAIAEEDFVINIEDEVYSGADMIKTIQSALALDIDYTVTYANNVNRGTATVTVKGIGNYTGEITKEFKINARVISAGMFSVNTKSVYYTGKTIKKSIVSKLKLGKDYTVTYKNNKYVGKATIIIKGIGNYSGSVTKTFKIVKPSVKKVKKISSLKSTKKKTATAKWTKVSGASGYAITYSMNKKFKKGSKYGTKTIYVKSYKTIKKVISKLKSGKTYYVKIAAYKNYKKTGSKKVYKSIGKYTTAKKVKIK